MTRRGVIGTVVAVIVATTTGAVARDDVGATDLLYMSGADWVAEAPGTKLALSRAFMRIYCTDARMPPERLVACLDSDGRADGLFERALACAAAPG